MPRPDENLTERFEMRASKEWIALLDNWRRAHPDLPSRGAAIRELVMNGLDQSGAPATVNDPGDALLNRLAKAFTAFLEESPERIASYGFQGNKSAAEYGMQMALDLIKISEVHNHISTLETPEDDTPAGRTLLATLKTFGDAPPPPVVQSRRRR